MIRCKSSRKSAGMHSSHSSAPRPEHYLWSYKHFRYRPKRATREYPFYANPSGKFEKVLQAGK